MAVLRISRGLFKVRPEYFIRASIVFPKGLA